MEKNSSPLPFPELAKQSARFLSIAFGISILLALVYWLVIAPKMPVPASPLPADSAAAITAEVAAAGDIGSFAVSLLCMLAPLAAAIACQLMDSEKPLRGIGISWKVNRWWFAAWLSAPVLTAVSILVSPLMPGRMRLSLDTPMTGELIRQIQRMMPGSVQLTPAMCLAFVFITSMVIGATGNAVFGFAEEIGWRGWWLSKFQGRSFLLTSTVIGAVWGLWHAPLILAAGHNYPDHPAAGCLMMVGMGATMAPIFQYFRVKSGSVLVAAILHGTINAFGGAALIFLDGFSPIFGGLAGLSGLLANVLAVGVLFAFDRFVTGEHIMTGRLKL